jgi:hypothetical protein
MKLKNISLALAWDQIRDSDLLLWRGPGMISETGRGDHYHASKMARWGSDIMVIDTHWTTGGDVRLLINDVFQNSGSLDWFKVNPHDIPYDRDGAIAFMRSCVDEPYGWTNLALAAGLHLPVIRRFIPKLDDNMSSPYPPFCSELCSAADNIGGGHDPVPWCSDRTTEPTDLESSDFYEYQGTLIWDGLPKQLADRSWIVTPSKTHRISRSAA